MDILHIDIETYSSERLDLAGVHRYSEAIDFEIMLVAYAINDGPVKLIDMASCERLPAFFIEMFNDSNVYLAAHNATFERVCLSRIGLSAPPERWICTQILSSMAGLPAKLEKVAEVLKLDQQKNTDGKRLIKLFSSPQKPTKKNNRYRATPITHPEKWQAFREYCKQDVRTEKAILERLSFMLDEYFNELPIYSVDQRINDRGVKIDVALAENAEEMGLNLKTGAKNGIIDITGIDKPNSLSQLKKWLAKRHRMNINSLRAETVEQLLSDEETPKEVRRVLLYRKELAKSSIEKYTAMLNCVCDDYRVRGTHQFYGAGTGRWAGRRVQLQNLPQNHLEKLDEARNCLSEGGDLSEYGPIQKVLSELIRTALVAPKGKTFIVADYSAIEARVLSWVSGESWRIKVFEGDGKIYEASASKMFNIPLEQITKESPYRQKGKVAELALGYEGSFRALEKMGGKKMGLTETEERSIVKVWRHNNKKIVELWRILESCAVRCVALKKRIDTGLKGIYFEFYEGALKMVLPSGRALYYWNARVKINRFGKPGVYFDGYNSVKKVWSEQETYGGKLTENLIQAIARDLLAAALYRLEKKGFKIVFHVHDEATAEVSRESADDALKEMCYLMCKLPRWAKGLPMNAEGYVTRYYKK